MNNQQDGNKVSYEVIKLKAHHAWYEKRIAGDPSLDFYDGYDIGFNAGLKYQSNIINESIKEQDPCNYCGKTIREQAKGCNEIPCYRQHLKSKEPVTDKEIDAEIERYIKQFWPRPEHGGAVRLGFKRAVRWMQEREINSSQKSLNKIDNWLNALIYEEGGKMNAGSLRTIELIRKEAGNILLHESLYKVQVDYYEDKIEMLQRLLAERDKTIVDLNEPIKDEELKTANEFLYESGVDTMSMQDGFNCHLFYAMERYAEQYAASKLNNSAGVWIKASERLPEKENDYFIINNGYKSVASFIKGDGFYRMGDKESRVSKWLDESKLNNTIEDKWIAGKVKKGWYDAGRKFSIIGKEVSITGMKWTPVLYDGEDDPGWIKSTAVEQ